MPSPEEERNASTEELRNALDTDDWETVTRLLNNPKSRSLVISAKVGWGDGTALHVACYCHKTDIAQVLLDAGADLAAVDKEGYSPLHIAGLSGSIEVARLLLDKGADITALNTYGWTALHASAVNGHLPVVKLLVENGAVTFAKSFDGRTAAMIAKSAGQDRVSAFLSNECNPKKTGRPSRKRIEESDDDEEDEGDDKDEHEKEEDYEEKLRSPSGVNQVNRGNPSRTQCAAATAASAAADREDTSAPVGYAGGRRSGSGGGGSGVGAQTVVATAHEYGRRRLAGIKRVSGDGVYNTRATPRRSKKVSVSSSSSRQPTSGRPSPSEDYAVGREQRGTAVSPRGGTAAVEPAAVSVGASGRARKGVGGAAGATGTSREEAVAAERKSPGLPVLPVLPPPPPLTHRAEVQQSGVRVRPQLGKPMASTNLGLDIGRLNTRETAELLIRYVCEGHDVESCRSFAEILSQGVKMYRLTGRALLAQEPSPQDLAKTIILGRRTAVDGTEPDVAKDALYFLVLDFIRRVRDSQMHAKLAKAQAANQR